MVLVGCNKQKNQEVAEEQKSPASVMVGLEGSERYADSVLGFSIALPEGMRVEKSGDNSILVLPVAQEPGPGPANFVYVSVVSAENPGEEGSVYNYNPEAFDKMMRVDGLGESVSLAAVNQPEFDEWFSYTLIEEVEVAGVMAKVFDNYKPWEFPGGTTETRYLFERDGTRYVLGYYTGGDSVGESGVDPRIARAVVMSFEMN